MLSKLESRTFFGIEFKRDVIDIREQFPLLPLDVAIGIAERYGIRYPNVPRTKTPAVLTTDFLVTIKQGNDKGYLPIACKYRCDLQDRYALEKLEIQRLFWAALGCNLKVVTEEETDATAAENLSFISSFVRSNAGPLATIEESRLLPQRLPPRTYSIHSLVEELRAIGGLDAANATTYLYASIWNHALRIDLALDFQETGLIDVLDWDLDALRTEGGRNSHANLA